MRQKRSAIWTSLLFTPPLKADDAVFWFMMQIAMIVGFGFSSPMNWFLLKQGIKEKM